MLRKYFDLTCLACKMFYMWKGNHRLMILWRHINNHHLINKVWHISNNNMIIDPRTCTIVFVNTINDINKWVFIFYIYLLLCFCLGICDHVKDNIFAKLVCIQIFKKMFYKRYSTSRKLCEVLEAHILRQDFLGDF